MVESASGELLREARRRAGLSQTALAARARTTQSVISVYEAGLRQPSVPTLAALIEATGHRLSLGLAPAASLSGPVGRRVRRRRLQVTRILETAGLELRGVFGSVARGDERPGSDIDLLIDVGAGTSLFVLGRVQQHLEKLLRCPVDLVPASDLKVASRDRVLAELVAL